VDVDVGLLEHRGVHAEGLGAALDQAQRRLRALAHHVAELAGEDEPAGAGRARRLDEQDVAAHRRPGEARGHARHGGPHRHLVLEARRAEDRAEVLRPIRTLSALPSAIRTAAWRMARPISRSSPRTPASRCRTG
jgi:hypothetical protein